MAADLATAFAEEWPRVVSAVLRATGDLDLAEDSAQEAFVRLADRLARGEEVRNPGAWATTVARHLAVDELRRRQILRRKLPLLLDDQPGDPFLGMESLRGIDHRLELIFVACDPVLSDEQQIALALRIVCGVPTADIATFFGLPEATVAARITRAKKAIGTAGVQFRLLDDADGEADVKVARLEQVLTTVYGVYTLGHSAPTGDSVLDGRLVALAVELARSMAREFPEDTEVVGLLAVIELGEARSPGRVGSDGVPLSIRDVDRSAWGRRRVNAGLDLAARALPGGGRFALQAGIAGLHTSAARWQDTDWHSIATLYDGLLRVWPAPVVTLGSIIANSHLDGQDLSASIAAALSLLDGANAGFRRRVMAAVAELYERSGDADAAASTFAAADGEPNAAVRRYADGEVARLRARGSPVTTPDGS